MEELDYRLCSVDEIPDEGGLRLEVEGRPDIAVFRTDEGIFVVDDTCTHSNASLSEDGYIEGPIVECTWHSGKFDLRTGEVVGGPCPRGINAYACTVRDGAVFVSLQNLKTAKTSD